MGTQSLLQFMTCAF